MKAGGRGVLPFVVGLGAAYGGYLVLRRVIPPPPENVTKPEPSSLGGGYVGGAPPGPVADEEPNGLQAMLQGFIDQFGQPTEAEPVSPQPAPMRFEDDQPAPAPRAPAPPPPRAAQPTKPAAVPVAGNLVAYVNRMRAQALGRRA